MRSGRTFPLPGARRAALPCHTDPAPRRSERQSPATPSLGPLRGCPGNQREGSAGLPSAPATAAVRPRRAPTLPSWAEAGPAHKSEPGRPAPTPRGKGRSQSPAALTSGRSSGPAEPGAPLPGSAGSGTSEEGGAEGAEPTRCPAPELNTETLGSHPALQTRPWRRGRGRLVNLRRRVRNACGCVPELGGREPPAGTPARRALCTPGRAGGGLSAPARGPKIPRTHEAPLLTSPEVPDRARQPLHRPNQAEEFPPHFPLPTWVCFYPRGREIAHPPPP